MTAVAPPSASPPSAPPPPPPTGTRGSSRVRELLAGAFSGTPGRMRLLGAVSIVACLLFGVGSFLAVTRLHADIGNARDHAAQLVRIQAIRTNLVKADANATNAFLVGGLEPTAARDAYTGGIAATARTLAEAAGAEPDDAASLERVNRVVTTYTGLIESARANNRQGFPVGAAYLRQASNVVRDDALPSLAHLVRVEQERVDTATAAGSSAEAVLVVLLLLAVAALVAAQVYLTLKTRRVLNPSLLAATGVVVVVGLLALGAMVWSRAATDDARGGPYRRTVALATARIGAFDAKSAEALTLVSRGSGAVYEERFRSVSKEAKDALASSGADSGTAAALARYLTQHDKVRALDDGGSYDEAVALATGPGAANQAFASFERVSARALGTQARDLSNDLADAATPLVPVAWLLLLAGVAAAVLAWRGMAQRLREYR